MESASGRCRFQTQSVPLKSACSQPTGSTAYPVVLLHCLPLTGKPQAQRRRKRSNCCRTVSGFSDVDPQVTEEQRLTDIPRLWEDLHLGETEADAEQPVPPPPASRPRWLLLLCQLEVPTNVYTLNLTRKDASFFLKPFNESLGG